MNRALIGRLGLVAFVLLGYWLWNNGALFPKERQLSWELGALREVARGVEIQLYDSEGDLLKRESWTFEGQPPPSLLQTLSLREGRYPARVFVSLESGEDEVRTPHISVTGEDVVRIRLDTVPRSR